MRFVLFVHSLVSCWNHGNAHFLRGVMRALQAAGHITVAFEPRNAWSRVNLVREQGTPALLGFHARFPDLRSELYDPDDLDLERALDGADVVLVHEWNPPSLVAAVGRHRQRSTRPYVLLFHDTHHRAVSAAPEIDAVDLSGYDGVLCFGAVLSDLYRRRGWAARAFTWHEAADVSIFRPMPELARVHDLTFVGNWGDEERSAELRTFLLAPIRALGLEASLYGVRYPEAALAAIADAGARFRGWIANAEVPTVFARHRLTVHVPRRPYVAALPGIPTIRVFEALACGIPLVSAPWQDTEGLFRSGSDYLVAETTAAMTQAIRAVLADPALATTLAQSGRERILARHTCAHRANELLSIAAALSVPAEPRTAVRRSA